MSKLLCNVLKMSGGGSNAPNTPSWLRACVAGRSIVVSGCISAPASWTNDQRLQQNFNCLSAFIIKLFAASPYSCRSEDERHCCTQRQFTSFKSHKTAQQSLQSCPLPINNVWQVFGSSCNSCQEQYYITYRCATSSFQSCTHHFNLARKSIVTYGNSSTERLQNF